MKLSLLQKRFNAHTLSYQLIWSSQCLNFSEKMILFTLTFAVHKEKTTEKWIRLIIYFENKGASNAYLNNKILWRETVLKITRSHLKEFIKCHKNITTRLGIFRIDNLTSLPFRVCKKLLIQVETWLWENWWKPFFLAHDTRGLPKEHPPHTKSPDFVYESR